MAAFGGFVALALIIIAGISFERWQLNRLRSSLTELAKRTGGKVDWESREGLRRVLLLTYTPEGKAQLPCNDGEVTISLKTAGKLRSFEIVIKSRFEMVPYYLKKKVGLFTLSSEDIPVQALPSGYVRGNAARGGEPVKLGGRGYILETDELAQVKAFLGNIEQYLEILCEKFAAVEIRKDSITLIKRWSSKDANLQWLSDLIARLERIADSSRRSSVK